MEIAQQLKTAIAEALEKMGAGGVLFTLEHPTELSHGDYATNAAMAAAKVLQKSPREVAELLKAEIERGPGSDSMPSSVRDDEVASFIKSIEIAGPGFINFKLSKSFFGEIIPEIILWSDDFGKNKNLSGQTWVIEHTSPNPNKAMHLGHLRNNLTGMAIANIAQANGVYVIRDEIDNNRGIAIAKLMWGYLKFGRKDADTSKTDVAYWAEHSDEWKTPDDAGMRPDRFVDHFYVLGAEDFKSIEIESIVRSFVVKWELKDETIWKLWKTVLDYSYAGQELTLKRLGNKWDYVWHEHEIYQEGKNLVFEGLKKNIFKQVDGGAVVTDFHDEKLPDTVLIKSDGTSLYLTQDIALTKLKREKYHADKLFWVIGPEQSLALKQLFRVCDQLGIGHESDYTHIAYGYVSILKNGQIEKMSSREGNVIYIDDLIDMVKSVVISRFDHADEKLAEEVAVGAVKFAILFTGRLTDTAFDIDRATNLEGDSGPYLQYTHARIQALLDRATTLGITPNYQISEISDLEQVMYRYPEVVSFALAELAPNYIATYLIEVAHAFNGYYGAHKIVDETDHATSAHRLAIARAAQVVLKNGLQLLGISAPGKM